MGRTYVLDGFPWELLGYSQATSLPIAQIASVVGVYGLSALVALVSAAAAYAAVRRDRRGAGAWPALVAAIVLGIGDLGHAADRARARCDRRARRCASRCSRGTSCRIRSGIRRMRDAIMQRYIDMTREAIGRNAQFILWPESATPLPYERGRCRAATRSGVSPARRRSRCWSAATRSSRCSPSRRRTPPPPRFYNAAYLVQPDGTTAADLPQDPPGAVRRVRAVQPAAVFRRAAGRGRVGVHARAPRRCCCPSPATWPAPRSATK